MTRWLLLVSLMMNSAVFAQGTTTGLGALELPFAARNASLADATVADVSSLLSAHFNPAVLTGQASSALTISHQRWFQDVTTNFLFASFRLWGIQAGVSVATASVPGIEIREIPGPASGTFDAQTAVIAGMIAIPYDNDLTVGASVKHVYEKIFVDEATSVLFDLGASYRTPVDGLSAGVSLRHFGISDKMRTRTSRLPTQLRVGAAYETVYGETILRGLLGVTTQNGRSTAQMHAGLEGRYAETVSLRLGYQSGYAVRGFSAGLGVSYGFLFFDYGYVPFSSDLGTAHLITVGIIFPS